MDWIYETSAMENIKFTMSYNQFSEIGIPWKSIEKVSRLPGSETLLRYSVYGANPPACVACLWAKIIA